MIKYHAQNHPSQSSLLSYGRITAKEEARGDTHLFQEDDSLETRPSHLRAPPRHTQPTSVAALANVQDTGQLGSQERAYLQVMRVSCDGLTDREAARLLALPASTVSARRNGIQKKTGQHMIINKQGERRKNQRGTTALVWRMRK